MNRKAIHYICLASIITLLISCDATLPQFQQPSGEATAIRIIPTLTSGTDATRAAIIGTTFPLSSTIGVCVINAGGGTPGVPHMAGYQNVRGVAEGAAWGWYVNGIYAGGTLAGFSSNSPQLNIYGYAPYSNATTFDQINQKLTVPFEIGTTDATASRDYMVARPVIGFTYTPLAELEYHHVMTCLRFSLRREYTKRGEVAPALPPLYIKTIQLLLDDGVGTPVEEIGVKGTIEASKAFVNYGHTYSEPDKTALVVTDKVASLTVTYTNAELPISLYNAGTASSVPYEWLDCDILIPELDASIVTARFTAQLTFTDTDGQDYVFDDGSTTTSFQFNLSDIECPDKVYPQKGLLRGYMYTFEGIVGTTVRYSTTPTVNKIDAFTDGEATVFPI
jgi:hypothetical protein